MATSSSNTVSSSTNLSPSFSSFVSPSLSSLNHAHHFISLKLTSTNNLFWKSQIVPFLCGQGLMGFVDGTIPYLTTTDSSASSSSAASFSSTPTLTPIQWTQQDQSIMTMLISSITEDVLPLIVGTTTSHEMWTVLEKALASPSNTRILNLHFRLQNLSQKDKSVCQYLHEAKILSDELAAAGRSLPIVDFNIYVFKGLRPNFKDLVTTLSARSEPVSFSKKNSCVIKKERRPKIFTSSNLSAMESVLHKRQVKACPCKFFNGMECLASLSC